MQADTLALKSVLGFDRRYVIPTFQRDYEWTLEGQWKLLYEDLLSAAERLQKARAQADALNEPRARADQKVTPHFLGAIVCDQLPSSTGGVDQRAVIDGQQRLTTLQLLARGILDVLLETGSQRAPQVRRLIQNPADVAIEPLDRYKLWPRRKDREVWPSVVADEIPPGSGHLYLEARAFFADQTRLAIQAEPDTELLDAIVDAFLGLFKLVVIDLEENDEAQVIFEVLNGRQTPLSAADLVKNLLFLRGDLSGEKELDQLYDQYWAPLDEPWWKATVGTGHAARGRRDVLLSAWLTAVSGQEASVGHLYAQVRSYLATHPRATEPVLKELNDYASAYITIYNPDRAESPVLSRAYSRIERIRVLTAVPLFLWLRILPPETLPLADHEAAVAAVESWVMRRMITGANTRGYGNFFVELLKSARAARGAGQNVAQAVIGALGSAQGALAWPTDEEVAVAFATNRFYNSFTQERIRVILGAIDRQLQTENPRTEPAEFDYEKLQIEHIMPQSWQTHWPLKASDPAQLELAAQHRRSVVQRIGNLTLVTPRFNQGVSNFGWDAKRPEFSLQSSLQLNKPVAASEQWDESAIHLRSEELASAACRVWTRPFQSVSVV
ncbi:DUF262 domain-containing protein [Paenarthrobacter histidinolovorans]|uniref:DUF262 domain-containing protein n=1 Tax=Paenarthrobacter histidinolovorans TaxID=43664 RepID=UPI00166329A4|nr:DUF262 domain-containing protein [Paenarthrobacter histidinolovorans]GGJ40032.1 hypothetical protein GCM10010052_41480 [Paenarthrobacter histidinolovorans]